jgi:hypothetical protein
LLYSYQITAGAAQASVPAGLEENPNLKTDGQQMVNKHNSTPGSQQTSYQRSEQASYLFADK